MINDSDLRTNIVSQVLRERRTTKVLATAVSGVDYSAPEREIGDKIVRSAIEDAGFAPFHYDRNQDGISEPWRFYIVPNDQCRLLASKLAQWYPDMKPTNKLPAMLSACGCLVLVFWLPQFDQPADDKQIRIDEEHLAAAAAATQNLLIALTARGLKTYWSSGGFFRTNDMKLRLGIATKQKLLSAVFVDYGAETGVEFIGGKQHANRQPYSAWTTTVSVDQQQL